MSEMRVSSVSEQRTHALNTGGQCACTANVGGQCTGTANVGGINTSANAFPVGVEPLSAFFARVPAFALALSGGADSACLLGAAAQAGCCVKAYMVKTAFQPESDVTDAKRVAQEWGVPFHVIRADVLSQPDICANTEQRCYFCKRFLFGALIHQARADGFSLVCDGTNASDNPARRPGFRALAELGVVSPLRRAGLSKDEVRAMGQRLEVSLARKPRFSCYAVHAPQGEPLTQEVIARVAASFENS